MHTQKFANYKLPLLGIKREKNPVGDLSKYQWDKENCINDLLQVYDLSMVNYSDLAEWYSLQRDDGKYQFIWNNVRSFEILSFIYNLSTLTELHSNLQRLRGKGRGLE